MKFCPKTSLRLGMRLRAMRSVPPPGGNWETRRTGFIGHVCAATPVVAHMSTSASAIRRIPFSPANRLLNNLLTRRNRRFPWDSQGPPVRGFRNHALERGEPGLRNARLRSADRRPAFPEFPCRRHHHAPELRDREVAGADVLL